MMRARSEHGGRRRRRHAYAAGWAAVAVNVVLFSVKYWAGLTAGSLAIVADAWHTLSDSVTSVIVLAGTAFGARPADREHPFGHERAEVIASLIIGVLLAILGVNFAVEAVGRLRDGTAASYGLVAVVVTVVSILAKEAMAQYAFHAHRASGNPSLRADGWHHRSDALSSVLILVGILVGRRLWWVDGVLAALIAGLLLYAAGEVLWKAVSTLLGERPSEELEAQIERVAADVIGASAKTHHVHVHAYGSVVEASFHIMLPGDMSLREGHAVASKIEERLRGELGVEATVHVEPRGEADGESHHRT
ncbi:MAG: cation diffusion facilitator family transporter [Spirochaetaceae bacterium]